MEAYVASVCFKCFGRFRGMLQLFHMDVASKSGMLHIVQVFQRHAASVSKVLFKMFYLF